MTTFDPSQQRVFELDHRAHARVLGAPGTGKSLLVGEVFARFAARDGWDTTDLLVLSPTRVTASNLNRQIAARWGGALGGSPVRTAVSLAFAILRKRASVTGDPPPRLLTGAAHDDAISSVVEHWAEYGDSDELPFSAEVMGSPAFRAELRELASVLDSFDQTPSALGAQLRDTVREGAHASVTNAPSGEFLDRWLGSLRVLEAVHSKLTAERPGELSPSALIRDAATAIRRDETISVPRLVLIDDAQELGESDLGLLSALADRGSRLWVFGDPDIATGAFQGERVGLLSGLDRELRRRRRGRGAHSSGRGRDTGSTEQMVVLEHAHRHSAEMRSLMGALTERIGAAGAGQQRHAVPVSRGTGTEGNSQLIEFRRVSTASEQLGAIGNRLRRRKLGLDGRAALSWNDMAIICRSRGEAVRISRALAGHQVPTSIASGGVVLREQQLVRDLMMLLKHAIGAQPLEDHDISALLGGPIGGLDPVALRRFRGAIRRQEIHDSMRDERAPETTDQIVSDGFALPGDIPIHDSRGGRSLRKLGRLARTAQRVHQRGGTAREVLWAIWSGTGLAESLQTEAIEGRGAAAAEAHRMLDAVMALFFALERHEEQDSSLSVTELIDELASSDVPQDTLAGRSEAESVTVTTPQGAIGREFSLVVVVGLQDGAWPNLRSRGVLLGARPLERWLRGGDATLPSRRDTLHDELRLFTQAVSRARDELLVVALANEDNHPSPFFGLGTRFVPQSSLPSGRLTLRGAVAEMRRRITRNPDDREAMASLLALIDAQAPGAHPDEWYGLLHSSTLEPLVDLEVPESTVRVSPSAIESAERCPLDWAISKLGGGESDFTASIGTLVHRALEAVTSRETNDPLPTEEEFMAVVEDGWKSLTFEAPWLERQQYGLVRAMAQSALAYLRHFSDSGRTLIGTEVAFSLTVGPAELSGIADRLEARSDEQGVHVSVVDLKTGKQTPSRAERESHAQLQAYQLGIVDGGYPETEAGAAASRWQSDGARLLYVHPETLSKSGPGYLEAAQEPLDSAGAEEFRERLRAAAHIMAAGHFTAHIEHHCDNEYALGKSCRIHVIPAVSHG